MARDGADPGVRASLTPCDEENRAEEREEQEDASQGRKPVERVESVERNRDHECDPKDDVEYHRGARALGRETKGVGLLGHAEVVEDPIRQGARGRGTSGHTWLMAKPAMSTRSVL